MEVRKRNTGSSMVTGIEEAGSSSIYVEDGEDAFREGLDLYSQAEQSNFKDTDVLTKSIKQVIKASERGVDQASEWMKSFLDSTSALPPSVTLPTHLLREMQVIRDATQTEKQVRLAAKTMFQKMACGQEAIPKKEISQKAKSLLKAEDAAQFKKSSRKLEGSINRLMHDALVINHTDEVCNSKSYLLTVAYVHYGTGHSVQW